MSLLLLLILSTVSFGLTVPSAQETALDKFMAQLESRTQKELSNAMSLLSPLWASELQTPSDLQVFAKDLGASLTRDFKPVASETINTYYKTATESELTPDQSEALAQKTLKTLSKQWRALSRPRIATWVKTRLRAPPTPASPAVKRSIQNLQRRALGQHALEAGEVGHALGEAGKIMGVFTLTIMFLGAAASVALGTMIPISRFVFRP